MNALSNPFSLQCSRCTWRGEDTDINRCPQCGFKDINAVQRMVEQVEMPLIKADDILQLAGR